MVLFRFCRRDEGSTHCRGNLEFFLIFYLSNISAPEFPVADALSQVGAEGGFCYKIFRISGEKMYYTFPSGESFRLLEARDFSSVFSLCYLFITPFLFAKCLERSTAGRRSEQERVSGQRLESEAFWSSLRALGLSLSEGLLSGSPPGGSGKRTTWFVTFSNEVVRAEGEEDLWRRAEGGLARSGGPGRRQRPGRTMTPEETL